MVNSLEADSCRWETLPHSPLTGTVLEPQDSRLIGKKRKSQKYLNRFWSQKLTVLSPWHDLSILCDPNGASLGSGKEAQTCLHVHASQMHTHILAAHTRSASPKALTIQGEGCQQRCICQSNSPSLSWAIVNAHQDSKGLFFPRTQFPAGLPIAGLTIPYPFSETLTLHMFLSR